MLIFLYALACYFLTLVGLLAVPLGLLFCNERSKHMPKAFWLWDNDVETINGDIYWRNEHHPADYWRFWPRFVWLALRNPVNNLKLFTFGFYPDHATSYTAIGDQQTSDQPHGHSGTLKIIAAHKGKEYTTTYVVKQYPFWRTRCFRMLIGWRNMGRRRNVQIGFVAALNPLKGFKAA